MKAWFVPSLFLWALAVQAEPLTLVNTLPSRPVFTLESGGLTQTRAVAPGHKIRLEAGVFSGLGEKKLALHAGTTYYLARFGATPSLYRLPSDQVLVLNQSGRAVPFALVGRESARGYMANGALALGALDGNNALGAEWDPGTGVTLSQTLEGGRVYRLVLASPEGIGTTVALIPWD